MPIMIPASPGARKGESVNGKQGWTGVAPSPKVFEQLDFEEISVLALLAWSSATNRPVTSRDVAALPDRDGNPLGLEDARNITETLSSLKIASVLGMRNEKPLSVFLGGFQPRGGGYPRESFKDARGGRPQPRSGSSYGDVRAAQPTRLPRPATERPVFIDPETGRPRGTNQTPPKPPAPRPKLPKVSPDQGQLIESKSKLLPQLRTTSATPDFVEPAARSLRAAQMEVEAGKYRDDPVRAAEERLRILRERINLYERWLRAEPRHRVLAAFLEQKRKALPELEFQLERVRMPGGSNKEKVRKAKQAGEK